VARYVRQLRQAQGLELQHFPRRRLRRTIVDHQRLLLTPRRAAWLVLRRVENLKTEEKEQLVRLKENSHFASAVALAETFIELVRNRQSERFDVWLEQALQSDVSPLRRFAEGLKGDYAAIKAGLTMAVSNSPTEGHINRLKMLKRQMYGRAGLPLLRCRFLLTA
jgi:transposase